MMFRKADVRKQNVNIDDFKAIRKEQQTIRRDLVNINHQISELENKLKRHK